MEHLYHGFIGRRGPRTVVTYFYLYFVVKQLQRHGADSNARLCLQRVEKQIARSR